MARPTPIDEPPRRRGRRILRALTLLAAALVLIPAALLLVLQFPGPARWAARGLIGAIPPFRNTTIRLDRVRGSWITSLELNGLRAARGDTLILAADTLRFSYSPFQLLRRRIVVRDLELRGGWLAVTRGDTTRKKPPGRPRSTADWLTGGFYTGIPIRAERISISRSSFVRLDDSTGARADDIRLEARRFALGGGPAELALDTLGARLRPPGPLDRTCRVGLSGALDVDRVQLRTLEIVSDSSTVRGGGTVRLSHAPRQAISGTDFALFAAPLDLADLALFFPGLDAHGKVEADVTLRGASREQLAGSVSAKTEQVTIGAIALGRTSASVRISGQRIDFETRASSAGVRIAVEGWLSGWGPSADGRIIARIDTLPPNLPGLPSWDRDAPRGARLDATMARQVARTRLELWSGVERLDLEGDVDLARLPTLVMRRGRIHQRGEGGREIPGGSLAFDSVRVMSGASPGVRFAGVRIDSLDLSAWLGVPALESTLDGTANGEYRWSNRSGRVRLALDPSTFRGQAIDRGTIDAQLDRGALSLKSSLDAGRSRLQLEGQGLPFAPDPRYAIRSARFEHLDLAPWTGNPAHATDLTGRLSLESSLGDSGFRDLSGTVALERSTGFGFTIRSGGANGRWSGDSWSTKAAVELPAGSIDVDASRSAGRLRVDGKAPLVALLALAGRDSLEASGHAQVTVDLSGPDLRTANGSGVLTASGRVGAARFDSVVTRFRATSGVFDVDTLIVASDAITAAGSGPLALFDTTGARSAFHATASITRSQALAALLGVDSLDIEGGRAEVDVQGPSRHVAFDTRVSASSVRLPGVKAHGMALQGRGILGPELKPDSLGLTGKVTRLQTAGFRMSDARVTLGGAVDSLTLDLGASLGANRGLQASAALLADSLERRLVVSTGRFGPADDPWVLTRPALVRFGGGWLAFDSFEARSDSGSVSMNGRLSRQGKLDFTAKITGGSIRGLTEWTQRDDLNGRLDASVRIAGSAERPLVTGEMQARLQAGRIGGEATARLDWKGALMDLDAAYRPTGSAPIEITAELPLVLSLAPGQPLVTEAEGEVKLHVGGKDVALASLSPFFHPRSLVPREGVLNLDLSLGGTNRNVQARGGASLSEGLIELPTLGVTYKEATLETRLNGRTVEVVRASAEAGKGSAEIRGKLNFERLSRMILDFDVHAHRFQAIATRDQNAVISGDIDLKGTPGEPVATGKVLVDATEIYLTPSATQGSDVRLTEADLQMLEEHFGDVHLRPGDPATGLYDAARLDLDVKLGSAVWIRQRVSPRIAAKLEGSFKLVKEPHGEPLLTGRIWPTPRRGFVEEFARQFDFAEGGEIRLNGTMKEHDIDLKAMYRIEDRDESGESQVVVHLDVRGRLDKLELILSSEPAMDQSEIINYIITGKSLSESNSSMGAGEMAAQVGLSRLTAGLEDYAQRTIGLDVVQVRQDGLQGTTLIAGRYMSPDLYVGFRQPVSSEETGNQTTGTANRTQYELEYSAYQWLSLNLLAETSKFKSFFRARHAY